MRRYEQQRPVTRLHGSTETDKENISSCPYLPFVETDCNDDCVCSNGGKCEKNQCDCASGFKGAFCDERGKHCLLPIINRELLHKVQALFKKCGFIGVAKFPS